MESTDIFSLPIEVQKMILDSMAEASQTKEKSKYSPNSVNYDDIFWREGQDALVYEDKKNGLIPKDKISEVEQEKQKDYQDPPIDFSFLFPENYLKYLPEISPMEGEVNKNDKENFTRGINFSMGATLIPGIGASEEITWDDEGSFGNLTTSYRSLGTPTIGAGAGYARTNAENIKKLRSQAYEGGATLGPISFERVNGEDYSGEQWIVGGSLPMAEVHGKDTYSDFTWMYDNENKELVINPLLIFMKSLGRGPTHMFLKEISEKGLTENNPTLIKIPLDLDKMKN